MLAGEQLDFPPQLLPNYSEGSTEEGSIAAKFPLPRDMSAEANQFIIGLLEMNPEKRLGSPNSPQGLIRDHPFFKVGRRIDWQEIEDGLFKPVHKNHMVRDLTLQYCLPCVCVLDCRIFLPARTRLQIVRCQVYCWIEDV